MSANPKHTPGPWHLEGFLVYGGNRLIGCVRVASPEMATEQDLANAILMAAATELLESLLDVLPELESVGPLSKFEKARSAIAKATGESTHNAGSTTKAAPC